MPRAEIQDGIQPRIGTHPVFFEHGGQKYLGVTLGIEARAFPTSLISDSDLQKIKSGLANEVAVFIEGARTIDMRVANQ